MDNRRNRKRNRLQYYDYSQNGYYFVTVCTWQKINHFGKIKNGFMSLNKFGLIVQKQWIWLSIQYPYVDLDDFIVMPNHIHGIIIINDNSVGNGRDRSLRKIKSISELIGAFKTTSSKIIHNAGLYTYRWQKSFHDHIIRDEADLYRIRQYIRNNPAQWVFDRNYPQNL